jgi:hypothetical protein
MMDQRGNQAVHTRSFLSIAKEIKHALFIAKKHALRGTYPARQRSKDAVFRVLERARPYRFVEDRYKRDFVANSLPAGQTNQLEKVIYCFWTGENELTPNRKARLESLMSANRGIEVRLVTPHSLPDFILADEPLHLSYKQLSYVHRSDYLRCYFMNFYGGGYCDIKNVATSWAPAFERLRYAPEKWALGYREVASDMTAVLPGKLGRDVRWHYSRLIGNGAFIMRSQTPLTREWYRQLMEKMDGYSAALKENPGNARGDNPGYPVPWIDLQGNILAPLALKYHERLIQDDSIRPRFTDYK